MIHAFHKRQIDHYFGSGSAVADPAGILQRLWRCASCRVRYERHLLLERTLPDGRSRGEDRLWRSIVASAGVGGAGVRQKTSPRWFLHSTALIAAGAVAFVLFVARRPDTRTESSLPVARGEVAPAKASPTLHLFRTVGEHETELVDRRIRANDGLLFAYSNPGADLRYLMVFAVDARGGIHWYYPAYERPGENPSAALIKTGALGVELGEEIRHPFQPGPLRVFALFLARPVFIDEIERMVGQAWRTQGQSLTNLDSLPVADGQQLSRLLEVTP
jgi:hypothetical protein